MDETVVGGGIQGLRELFFRPFHQAVFVPIGWI
jgi:hypothetical protein